ncbi:MAG: hypothetical protein U0522_02280 [Candidatus Paceibacterota bacterium]
MTLQQIFAMSSAVLMVIGSVWQVYVAIRYPKKVRPTLASWIIFSTTLTLSFVTYWTTKERNLVSNAANASAMVGALIVFLGALAMHIRSGNKLAFSRFQKGSLTCASLIALVWVVMVWGLGYSGLVPNILTQVLMIIGYCVTADKVWRATSTSESFFLWWCIFASSMLGLVPACARLDALAILYATRATVCTGLLLILLYRIKSRSSQASLVTVV